MPTAAASTCEPGTAPDGREHRFTELPAGLYGSIGGERGDPKGRVVITSNPPVEHLHNSYCAFSLHPRFRIRNGTLVS